MEGATSKILAAPEGSVALLGRGKGAARKIWEAPGLVTRTDATVL